MSDFGLVARCLDPRKIVGWRPDGVGSATEAEKSVIPTTIQPAFICHAGIVKFESQPKDKQAGLGVAARGSSGCGSLTKQNSTERLKMKTENSLMKTTTEISIEAITTAGHDEADAAKVRALCAFLDCEPDDLSRESHDHYGLAVYSQGSREYAIGTDSEADSACVEYCRDSVWAFNASFILEQCGLPGELDEAIKAFQEDKCESANDALLALVEKCCKDQSGKAGIEAFTDDAISADGRGRFLSGYDGEENDQDGFYIYRIN